MAIGVRSHNMVNMARPGLILDILGIEGGGTKTTWALVLPDGRVKARGQAGPGNTLLLSDAELAKLFRTIHGETGSELVAIGGAFAGCLQLKEQQRVEEAIRKTWPKVSRVVVMEDTRSVLAAAFGDAPGVVVIAGTGSNVAGQNSFRQPMEKAAGWGHLFADRGSAYDLARRGLERAFDRYDETLKVTPLAREFLNSTGNRTMEDMVTFLLVDTGKNTIAQHAASVFAAAKKGDVDARALLDEAAAVLAQKVMIVAKRLKLERLEVALTGGLFENQPDYLARFQRALAKLAPKAKTSLLTVPGAFGAARVAGVTQPPQEEATAPAPIAANDRLAAFASASTEQRNPRSAGLDRRNVAELVDLFIAEEKCVDRALTAQRKEIAKAAELVSKKLIAGGRLIYVGAGTSGRLGVVDASEMPPTFNAPPEQIQAIIAGGPPAVFRSQEGAEDDRDAGAAEVKARRPTKNDVVCGITASGQAPYVLGALAEARQAGAATILLTCNPKRALREPVDLALDLDTGPEIVTGSTRLKAGTATKLVLNMLSTIAMIRLGRVQDNLMVNVQATNDKLRARAVRLVQDLTKRHAAEAQNALEKNRWNVIDAIKSLRN